MIIVESVNDCGVMMTISLIFQPLIHELRITNQVIYVNPPIEEARVNIMQELFAWEAVITSLPRITHSRYTVSIIKHYSYIN